jgi:hypothetical protein
MRRTGLGLGLLGSALLSIAGCHHNSIRPPVKEAYALPPADDQRFSSPPTYPKETLDTAKMKKDAPKLGDQDRSIGTQGMGMRGAPGGYPQ